MKKLLTYIVLSILVVAPFAQSQAQNRQRFDGGMMVHTLEFNTSCSLSHLL